VALFSAENAVLDEVFLQNGRHFFQGSQIDMKRTIAKILKKYQCLMISPRILEDYEFVVHMLQMDVK
jgi:hypothetical protein